MAAAYSRTYADSVDAESWQNNTNAWRERLSSLVNAKFADPETNTDFERTVLTDRPDLSKSKHVNEFPDRNMPDVEDAVEQSLTDRLGINTGSNEWVELSEGETFDSDPVNAHASGNNKNTMEESLDDEDASFESFRYPDSVSEDVNPSWVFTGIDSDESDQPGGREEVVTKRRPMDKDKKVFVYGQDDRLRVFLSQMRKFPFSNIARLSTGCTGTLVTPRHVLTAAHCVHNGLDFRSNLEMLKIEIPDTMGFRTYYAQKISVPTGWLRDVDSNSINGYQSGRHAAYDYAVVRLKLAVAGRNRFLPLAVPRADVLTLDIHFLAFPESDHGLWRSVCPASSHMARMDGNLILTRCDAAVGNSGAAVFTNEPHEGMRVVGVLSNTMHVAHHRSFDRYSIITALTWPKLADICRQLGSLAQQYNVCPPFRYMRREPPPLRLTAIPFFGKRQGGPV
nr:hypothetical protein BaRGS_023775 [Batillaria attramentaria]